MDRLVSIHPAQTADLTAEYDPKLPVPVPYHIKPDGSVDRQDHWRGKPYRLAGFTDSPDIFEVSLSATAWLAGDVKQAIGQFAVFMDRNGGGLWTCTNPIDRVTTNDPADDAPTAARVSFLQELIDADSAPEEEMLSTAAGFVSFLQELLDGQSVLSQPAQTFADAGILTQDGLVVDLADGSQFHIIVTRTRG